MRSKLTAGWILKLLAFPPFIQFPDPPVQLGSGRFLPWVHAPHPDGRRLAKRADSTKRTKWRKYWSRVTSGSNRQKPRFHVNATLLWSRLILLSDQTGFPTWEVKYADHMSCRVYFSRIIALTWKNVKERQHGNWLEKPTDKRWQGLHFLDSRILEQIITSRHSILSEKLSTSQNRSAKLQIHLSAADTAQCSEPALP